METSCYMIRLLTIDIANTVDYIVTDELSYLIENDGLFPITITRNIFNEIMDTFVCTFIKPLLEELIHNHRIFSIDNNMNTCMYIVKKTLKSEGLRMEVGFNYVDDYADLNEHYEHVSCTIIKAFEKYRHRSDKHTNIWSDYTNIQKQCLIYHIITDHAYQILSSAIEICYDQSNRTLTPDHLWTALTRIGSPHERSLAHMKMYGS